MKMTSCRCVCVGQVDDITGPNWTSDITLLLFLQGHYGILVEVANENDNRPKFQQETVEQLSVSEVNPTLTVSKKPAASVPKTTQYSAQYNLTISVRNTGGVQGGPLSIPLDQLKASKAKFKGVSSKT